MNKFTGLTKFISRRSLISVLISFVLTITAFAVDLTYIKQIFAADNPWTQTDWSGGTAVGTISGAVTTYESASDIDTSVAGELTLQQAAGWSSDFDGWAKRKLITVTNSGLVQTNYQIRLDITYDADMQADFDDIRFTNSAGTSLDYWIQEKTDSIESIVWIEVDDLAASGTTEIYLYYGNSGASSGSNGTDTFIFFDDFSSGTIDSEKWVVGGSGSHSSIMSGELKVGEGNSAWNQSVYSVSIYTRADISFDMKYRWTSANASYDALMFGWHDSGTGNSYTDLVHGYYNSGTGTCTSGCAVNVYEDGNNRSPIGGVWTQNQQYMARVRMRSAGGAYYEQSSNSGENWTTSYTSSYSTESNLRLGISLYAGVHMFDDMRIRKWMTSEPSSVFGSEVNQYPTSGSINSNIFDAESGHDWGTLTYTSSGSGTVEVKVRSSSSADMSGATDFSSCSAVSSGNNIDTGDCATDNHRYLQYQITLLPSGADTPTFQDITLNMSASDIIAPATNATSILMYTSNGGRSISSNGWSSSIEPYFSWTAGADDIGGGGLRGYCLYLGTDSGGNPATSKGILGTSPVSLGNSDCQFIVSSTSIDLSTLNYLGSALVSGTTYYLNIKATDLANNIFAGSSTQFQFRQDSVVPTNVGFLSMPSGNFSNVEDMSFSWPTSGGTAAADADSGLLGYQYQINSSSGAWLGTSTDTTCSLDYIPSATGTYDLVADPDEDVIVSGNNVIYFRTVDTACNTSSGATYRTGNLSFGGQAPAFGGSDVVTITPSSAVSNSYALSWSAASPAAGRTVTDYFYMINTSPPSTYATLVGNASTYIDNGTTLTVSADSLSNVNKGSNTVYVVAVDDDENYSPSNFISGTFTLNSTDPDNVGDLIASDSSIKAQEQWNITLTWTAPAYEGAGNLTYLVHRSKDGSTFSQVGTTAGLSYVDTTPTSDQYYYKIYSKDGADSQSSGTNSVSLIPTGRWTEAPTIEGDPTVTNITTKKATITWSTSRTSDSKVQIGTSSGDYNSEETSESAQVTSHGIDLDGLSPGTTYYYKAKWTDEDGNTGESEEFEFSTSPAPTVTEPVLKNLGISSAIIQFTVSDSYSAKIYYGKSTSFGGTTEVSTSPSESIYNILIDGLEDGTKYFYKINTFDIENDEYEGSTLTFETLPRPQISSVRIQQVANSAQSTVLITWQTNTEVSSIITHYPENDPSQARDEVNIALQRGEHRMVIRGLQPQSGYALLVKGIDKAGNQAISDIQRFTTATDTRPPQISELNTEGSTQVIDSTSQESNAQLIVSWNTDEPSTSQVEFGEGAGTTYSQKTQEDSNLTLNHLVVISGLTPSKVYHLRAISKDSNGNPGESIDTVTITPKATDNALDLVISNLQEAFGFLNGL